MTYNCYLHEISSTSKCWLRFTINLLRLFPGFIPTHVCQILVAAPLFHGKISDQVIQVHRETFRFKFISTAVFLSDLNQECIYQVFILWTYIAHALENVLKVIIWVTLK